MFHIHFTPTTQLLRATGGAASPNSCAWLWVRTMVTYQPTVTVLGVVTASYWTHILGSPARNLPEHHAAPQQHLKPELEVAALSNKWLETKCKWSDLNHKGNTPIQILFKFREETFQYLRCICHRQSSERENGGPGISKQRPITSN